MTSPKTIAVKLKATAEWHVKKHHPWVYDEAIIKESKEPNTGDIAIIFDSRNNRFLAVGIYDCDSPIRIKVLQAHEQARLNPEYFDERLEVCYTLRKPLLSKATNAYRLINGEGDRFPSLIVDVYDTTVVIKLYSLCWMPYLEMIMDAIQKVIPVDAIVCRSSRNIERKLQDLYDISNGTVLYGDLSDPVVIFRENNVLFAANVVHGHKTGFFLDHRANRHKIGTMARGKRVLDIFSYAGGFSVHALAGGASEVVSIDISKQALELAKSNVQLNSIIGKHTTIASDAFEAMESLAARKQLFDIVVVDPPSFAKETRDINKAIASYKRLAQLAIPLVAKNGVLCMASCSSRVDKDTFFQTIEDVILSDNRFTLTDRSTHDIDHPVLHNEGWYLKTAYYRRQR